MLYALVFVTLLFGSLFAALDQLRHSSLRAQVAAEHMTGAGLVALLRPVAILSTFAAFGGAFLLLPWWAPPALFFAGGFLGAVPNLAFRNNPERAMALRLPIALTTIAGAAAIWIIALSQD